MKVFKMNQCDWVAAENLMDACKVIIESGNDIIIEDPKELSEEEMNTKMHTGDDGQEAPVTFRTRLDQYIKEGRTLPDYFASTEI